MSKPAKISLIVAGILVIANLLFLNFKIFFKDNKSEEIKDVIQNIVPTVEPKADACALTCQQFIGEKITEELAKLPSLAGQSSVSQAPTVTNGKPKVVYVPLVTDGTVASINWTDIVPSEFYFDLGNYPQAKEVRFEAFLLSLNNDLVTARLYDQTNKRAVDFSDLQTKNSTFARIESGAITIWQGNNKYTVQLRSVNGTQAQLKDAKIKIIY